MRRTAMRIIRLRALITSSALVLALGTAACDHDDDVGPYVPAPLAATTDASVPDDEPYVPGDTPAEPDPDTDDPGTLPEPPEDVPDTNPCAYPGDPLCPDT